jgi:hypothetical protein
LTDGHVPKSDLGLIFPGVNSRRSGRLTARLLAVDLLVDHESTLEINDFLHYNDSREIILRKRKVARQKKSRQRAVSRGDSPGDSRGRVPDPTRPDPLLPPPSSPPGGAVTVQGDLELKNPETGEGLSDDQSIRIVFATWVSLHVAEKVRSRAVLTPKRRKRIKARLGEGYTAGRLQAALRGALADRWLMGLDPKSPRAYRDIETLLRDGSQVERLEALDGEPPADPSGAAPISDFSDVDEEAEMERFHAELAERKRRKAAKDG